MKKLSDMEKKTGSKVLDDLRSHMQSMMGDKMKGLKKVTVASDSPEGLKKGLQTAEGIVGKPKSYEDKMKTDFDAEPETDDLESSDEDGLPEDAFQKSDSMYASNPEEGEPDGDECSTPEEIDAKIAELMDMKKQMLAKK